MNSLLLTTLARGLFGLLLIVSLYLLYRGHNEPGGGFIGGLVAAVAFALAAKGLGLTTAKQMLKVDPQTLVGLGLLAALISGLMALFFQQPIFTGQWLFLGASETSKGFPLSSVLLFDIGVYLIVVGATLMFFFNLEDPED